MAHCKAGEQWLWASAAFLTAMTPKRDGSAYSIFQIVSAFRYINHLVKKGMHFSLFKRPTVILISRDIRNPINSAQNNVWPTGGVVSLPAIGCMKPSVAAGPLNGRDVSLNK